MASAPAKGGSTPAKGGPGKGGARTTSAPPAPNYNSPLYQPGQQLAGKSLSDAAHGIANAATDGPLSALAQQIAQNNQQGAAAQKTTMGYYMQLAKDAQAAYGQMQGVNSGLTNQLNSTEWNTAGALNNIGQNAQSGAMGRLAGMGLGGDSPGMLANQTAQNQSTGVLNYQNFKSAGAMQNANYSDHALGAIQAQGLRGQERIGNMAQATRLMNQPLSAKEATLIANRGNLYSNALGTLRGQERNYQVAQAGLGLKADTLKVTAANDAAKNSLTARGQNITSATAAANRANQAGIAAANRAQSDTNNLRNNQTSANNNAATNSTRALIAQQQQANKNGYKPASRQAAQAIYSHVSYLADQLNQMISNGISPVTAYHYLQNGVRLDTHQKNANGQDIFKTYPANKLGPQILNAAYNTRQGAAGLSPGDVAWFHSMGINVKGQYPIAPNTSIGGAINGAANNILGSVGI